MREELGQSLRFKEDDEEENGIFNEQQESLPEIENNLNFYMPVDLGVDKILVENLLDNLTPTISTANL